MSSDIPRHFVVIVPGYMGSKLRDRSTGEIIWLDVQPMLKNPLKTKSSFDHMLEKMAYPNQELEPAGIMDQVLFLPPWIKQEHYGRLTDYLKTLGYRIDPEEVDSRPAAYTFSYDWRQDNRISARQLAAAVEAWRQKHDGTKAWLIGHSNGGIVSRWYIQKEGGDQHVERLFLMGSPWDGAPKSIRVMQQGLDTFMMRVFDLFGYPQKLRDLIRSFPSFYQLIPHTSPFLRDEQNQEVNVFSENGWLESDRDREYLADALRFNQELGTDLNVDTVCFFGRMKPTTTKGVVRRDAAGRWLDIQWTKSGAGDGTVPEHSAVHPKARAGYAFAVDHGSIYVDPQTLPQLEWELVGKYQAGIRALLVTQNLTIYFDPEKDVVEPGEDIHLQAAIHRNEDGSPITAATIHVQLLWEQALPGQEEKQPPGSYPRTSLDEKAGEPGAYQGVLPAPQWEGYYKLHATVEIREMPNLTLDEILLVEKIPDIKT